jgi:hypothetical protein
MAARADALAGQTIASTGVGATGLFPPQPATRSRPVPTEILTEAIRRVLNTTYVNTLFYPVRGQLVCSAPAVRRCHAIQMIPKTSAAPARPKPIGPACS